MYSLKNIRRIRGLEGAGITASIYHGGVRVGWVQVPADGGTALFTFDMDGERSAFEQYVEQWWSSAQAQVAIELTALEFARTTPGFAPRLQAKLKYWVTALVEAATLEKRFRPAV
ncbi:MAG TPA: hypothetical protein VJ652_09675 [Noviherbaspirillum sp.]|nr:hypothetical protein [Noviherbaspirillum sp.]